MGHGYLIRKDFANNFDVADALDDLNARETANAAAITANAAAIATNITTLGNDDSYLSKINISSTTEADMESVSLSGLNGDEFLEVEAGLNFSGSNTSDVIYFKLTIDDVVYPTSGVLYATPFSSDTAGRGPAFKIFGDLQLTGQTSLDVKLIWAGESSMSGTAYSNAGVIIVKICEGR